MEERGGKGKIEEKEGGMKRQEREQKIEWDGGKGRQWKGKGKGIKGESTGGFKGGMPPPRCQK